jgi:hypothetical protein
VKADNDISPYAVRGNFSQGGKQKGIQAFIEVLNSEGFRNRVAKLGNYDFKSSGKILYSKN